MKLEGTQPPSPHSALRALVGLSDLLAPSFPSPGRRENKIGESDRKCHIARNLNFLP